MLFFSLASAWSLLLTVVREEPARQRFSPSSTRWFGVGVPLWPLPPFSYGWHCCVPASHLPLCSVCICTESQFGAFLFIWLLWDVFFYPLSSALCFLFRHPSYWLLLLSDFFSSYPSQNTISFCLLQVWLKAHFCLCRRTRAATVV